MKKRFSALLISIYALVQSFILVVDLENTTVNMVRAIPGLMCLLFVLFWGDWKTNRKGILIAFLMSLAMFFSMVYNGNSHPQHFLWIWSFMGVSLLLYEFGLGRRLGMVLFYVCSLFFVYAAITNTGSAKGILYGVSENNISTICILVLIIYLLANLKKEKKRMPYIPALVIMFLSLWTATRSGLFAMGVYLVWAVLYNNIGKGRKISQIFLLVVLAVSVSVMFDSIYQTFGIGMQEKIDRYGSESIRTSIWRDYLRASFRDGMAFLFGPMANDSRNGLFYYYSGNAHNAFLELHSKYGLIGFCFVIVYLIKAILKAIRLKEFYLLSLLVISIVRSMFDWTAFPGNFDVIFYFFIIYAMDKRKRFEAPIVGNRKMVRKQ